jgi:putative sigma-54 modulation protein
MNIKIKASRMELTPSIEDYVYKRMEAVTKLIAGQEESTVCDVEVGKTTEHHNKGDVFRAEVNLTVSGKQYYASSEKGDLYSAIDHVQSEIVRELKTGKEKRLSAIRRGGARIKDIVRGFYKGRKG